MRPDPIERKALKSALAGIDAERVFLFGSRVDDTARGGDIDILVYSRDDPLKLSRRVATQFFPECEERIDVIVMNPRRLTAEQRAFLAEAPLHAQAPRTLRCDGGSLHPGGRSGDSLLQRKVG